MRHNIIFQTCRGIGRRGDHQPHRASETEAEVISSPSSPPGNSRGELFSPLNLLANQQAWVSHRSEAHIGSRKLRVVGYGRGPSALLGHVLSVIRHLRSHRSPDQAPYLYANVQAWVVLLTELHIGERKLEKSFREEKDVCVCSAPSPPNIGAYPYAC